MRQSTLNRFYSLHFILPLVLAGAVMVHLAALHKKGSTNPIGDLAHTRKVPFAPYFIYKDLVGFAIVGGVLLALVMYTPNALGDPENFIKANNMVTPVHIIPEWYFLFAYAILRVIPRKLGGVVALVRSIMVLYVFPVVARPTLARAHKPVYQVVFWSFVIVF